MTDFLLHCYMHLSLRYYLLSAVATVCFALSANAQTPAAVFDLTQYEQRVQQKNDTLYVVNFWATWCKPCIEELPYFQSIADSSKGQPIKLILVSQDTKTRALQVTQFMQKKSYTSEYFILSAGNPNVWIDKIEPKWSGTIPATILYKNGVKVNFHEGDFPDVKTLNDFIHSKL